MNHATLLRAILVLAVTIALLVGSASALAAGSATRVPRAAVLVDPNEIAEVRMINQYRAARGLARLHVDGTLTRAAGWMAYDMGRTARFGHTDSHGRDAMTRLRAFGYPSNDTWRGENLAAGNAAPRPTLQQWIDSPPHRANMLNPRFRAIGIARVRVAGSSYQWYWATTFGSRWTVRPGM